MIQCGRHILNRKSLTLYTIAQSLIWVTVSRHFSSSANKNSSCLLWPPGVLNFSIGALIFFSISKSNFWLFTDSMHGICFSMNSTRPLSLGFCSIIDFGLLPTFSLSVLLLNRIPRILSTPSNRTNSLQNGISLQSKRIARTAMHNVAISLESSSTDAIVTPMPLANVHSFSFDSRAKLPNRRQTRSCTRGFGILFRMVSNGGTMPKAIACLQQSFCVQQLPKILSAISSIFSYGLLSRRTNGAMPPASRNC